MAISHTLTFCPSSDLAASERFYGDTLGLEVAIRTKTAILWRVTETSFVGVTAGPTRDPKHEGAIVDLVVESAEEVQTWYDKITADGWKTDGTPRHVDMGATLFFASDPDDYLVEVLHFDDIETLTGA